jgi:hypothetical protein
MPVGEALQYEQSDAASIGCHIRCPKQQIDAAARSAMHRGGRECVQLAEPVFALECRFHNFAEVEPSDAHAALLAHYPSSLLFFGFLPLSGQKVGKGHLGLAGGLWERPVRPDLRFCPKGAAILAEVIISVMEATVRIRFLSWKTHFISSLVPPWLRRGSTRAV